MPAADYWEDLEVITVETPENLELRFPLAGIGPRFLALLIDWLIMGVASFLLIIVLSVAAAVLIQNNVDPEAGMYTVIAVMVLVLLLITVGYPVYFEWAWNGQSPGKRVAGIRVIGSGGLPLEFRQILLRNIFRLVDYFPTQGFTGLVSFLATRHQQRVGDLVAGTIVVREFRDARPYSWPGGGMASYPEPGRGVLTPRLSYAIGSYLGRSYSFETGLRLELSGEIIRQLGYNPDNLLLRERESYLASLMQSAAGPRI
jgi:uncharacterized RDD family membrane protein YckC